VGVRAVGGLQTPSNPPLYGQSLDKLGKDPEGPWNMHPPSCAWALA
jgi:hypothetical protein